MSTGCAEPMTRDRTPLVSAVVDGWTSKLNGARPALRQPPRCPSVTLRSSGAEVGRSPTVVLLRFRRAAQRFTRLVSAASSERVSTREVDNRRHPLRQLEVLLVVSSRRRLGFGG